MLVFYSGFQTFSISERKRSSLGGMTFCVKWYLPNKRQIRTHPRLGTSSDFVVLVETTGLEPDAAFYRGKKVIRWYIKLLFLLTFGKCYLSHINGKCVLLCVPQSLIFRLSGRQAKPSFSTIYTSLAPCQVTRNVV